MFLVSNSRRFHGQNSGHGSYHSSIPKRFGRTVAASKNSGFVTAFIRHGHFFHTHGQYSGHGNALQPNPENNVVLLDRPLNAPMSTSEPFPALATLREHSVRRPYGAQFSPRRGFHVAENAQPCSVPSQSHCVIWNSEKLQRPGEGSWASLPGRSVLRRHSLGVQQQSDPAEKSVRYVLWRTFSISRSMAASSSPSRTFSTVRPPRTPRPPAPPSNATASHHRIAPPPRLLLRRARSWPREPR